MQFVKVVINFTWYCLELWLCRILNLSSQKVILCGNSLHRELKAGPLQWANNSIGLVPETDRLHRRKSLWRQSGEIVRCLQWGAWRSSKDHTHTEEEQEMMSEPPQSYQRKGAPAKTLISENCAQSLGLWNIKHCSTWFHFWSFDIADTGISYEDLGEYMSS